MQKESCIQVAIFNAVKEYGLPEPKFQKFDNMFRVKLFRNNSMTGAEKEAGEGSEIIRGCELADTQKKIINILLYDKQLSEAKIAE